jgi:hypothetical protein
MNEPEQHSETQNPLKIMREISINPVNPRVLLYAACFLCLHTGSAPALQGVKSGANLSCAGVINTRVVRALSIDEISKLGGAVSLQNNFGGLTVQPFDDDDRPRRGKEIEIGFVLARSGDLGGTPVGLIIWSERNLNFNFSKSSEGAISVESSDLKSCHVLATFTLSGKGYVLRDRRAIAQVH